MNMIQGKIIKNLVKYVKKNWWNNSNYKPLLAFYKCHILIKIFI